MKKTLITRRVAILAAASLSFLAACGGSGDSGKAADTTSAAASPGNGKKILSLSPTATEMLYAVGAGEQVVAVDEYSNFPQEAVDLGTKLSGYEPNIEAISEFTPDLVIASYDPGSLVQQLGEIGVPVYLADAVTSIDAAYEQIENIGLLTGHAAEAAALTESMRAQIEEAVAGVTLPAEPLSYYHELDNTLYSVTSNTFIGSVYSLFGLRNIADNVEAGNDYPQLSAEVIVSADPDLIFLADTKCCGETGATVAARDGWGSLKAVTNGNVIELDDDIPSRWGPRIVDFVIAIRDAIAALLANA